MLPLTPSLSRHALDREGDVGLDSPVSSTGQAYQVRNDTMCSVGIPACQQVPTTYFAPSKWGRYASKYLTVAEKMIISQAAQKLPQNAEALADDPNLCRNIYAFQPAVPRACEVDRPQ